MNENSDIFDLKVQRNDFEALLEDRRKNKEFTDVQLKVGDKLFDAHRVVLSLYSPVLKAMISEQWSTTKICPISDGHVDVDIVEDLLSFLYTGSIKLTPDNVQPVCMAAHFLQIPTLLEPSVKYLCQFVNLENVLTLFEFSTLSGLEDLNYSCLRLVTNNHEKIFQSSEILKFSFENFKDLIAGLKKFWAKLLREDTFHCIIRWTEENLLKRLDYLPTLLENIPLEELPFAFLTETVSNHPLVKNSIFSVETVSTALANYQTYLNSELRANQNLVVIEEWRYKNTDHPFRLWYYDLHTCKWRKLPDMPAGRPSFDVTVINHQDIIVCGGYSNDSKKASNSVQMFDWSKQSWTELPEMPFEVMNTSIAKCSDILYVLGSRHDGLCWRSTALCYSFKTQEWISIASLNAAGQHAKLIGYKNHLYAIGGYETTFIEKFDPAANQWTTMASIPKYWYCFAVTLHQDKFYVHDKHGFDVYDPEENAWSSIAAPVKWKAASLVSMNDKLLVVEGNHMGVTDFPNGVYEFDLSTNKYIEFTEFTKLTPTLNFCHPVVGGFY